MSAVEDERGSQFHVVDAASVDPQRLYDFLQQAVDPAYAELAAEYGDWWLRRSGRQIVVMSDGSVVGYEVILPTACLCGGRSLQGSWRMNLFVSPQFRGLGVSALLDRPWMEASDLRLSFVNKTGAAINAKHGFTVTRGCRLQRVPLHPMSFLSVKESSGARKVAFGAMSMGLLPVAAAVREEMLHYRPRWSAMVDALTPEELEGVFRRYASRNLVTTVRDCEFMRWRYHEAPYRQQLGFYSAGSAARPIQYAIVRSIAHGRGTIVRLLDVFGDFEESDILLDLLKTIVRDASLTGATYAEILCSWPYLIRIARRAGFLVGLKRRFSWLASDPAVHAGLNDLQKHWTMGDADNDAFLAGDVASSV